MLRGLTVGALAAGVAASLARPGFNEAFVKKSLETDKAYLQLVRAAQGVLEDSITPFLLNFPIGQEAWKKLERASSCIQAVEASTLEAAREACADALSEQPRGGKAMRPTLPQGPGRGRAVLESDDEVWSPDDDTLGLERQASDLKVLPFERQDSGAQHPRKPKKARTKPIAKSKLGEFTVDDRKQLRRSLQKVAGSLLGAEAVLSHLVDVTYFAREASNRKLDNLFMLKAFGVDPKTECPAPVPALLGGLGDTLLVHCFRQRLADADLAQEALAWRSFREFRSARHDAVLKFLQDAASRFTYAKFTAHVGRRARGH